MTKERLSKLQRVILHILLQNGGTIKEPKNSQNRKLYTEVLRQLSESKPVNNRSVSASLSRSINNLWDKGYIECSRYEYGSGLASIKLTAKGYRVLQTEPVNDKSLSKIENERLW